MMSYSSEILTSIKDVTPEEWNEVVARAPTIRQEVLSLEESNTAREDRVRYFLLRDEHNCLQAVSIAICVDNNSEYGTEGFVFGRFAKKLRVIQNLFRPALICGLLGHGAPVCVRPGKNQSIWLKRVLNVMESYAGSNHYSIGFIHALPEQLILIKELHDRGYLKAYGLPEAKISITWKDEDSYLKMLRQISKKYYRSARSEINKFRKAGISISEWDGVDALEIFNLLQTHHDERNEIKLAMFPESIVELKNKLGEECKIYTAKRENVLVGVAIFLKKGEFSWAWKVGIDHAADGNSFTYFYLVYYYFLSEAPKFNLKKIWYGNAALYAKIRRGCEVDFTYFYYKPKNKSWNLILCVLFMLQRLWYRKKFSSYINTTV